jgi:hypothetical protein
MASNAVDFPRPTSLLVLYPTRLKECLEVAAKNQDWAFVITGWEPSSFDPSTHCVFMDGEQRGDLFHGVAKVDLDTAGVGVTFSHQGLSAGGFMPLTRISD